MEEEYFKLKHKLEELGYNYKLPFDAVPLVECIVADLLQTTRSLQQYMDLSKDALKQRDSLIMAAEPYKCDNIRLIQENNELHQDNIRLKEEKLKLNKESKFKIKNLTNELSQKELLISKLQHEIRDLSLRGLCADTLSSRNKSKKRDGVETYNTKICICKDKSTDSFNDVTELRKNIELLQTQLEEYTEEIGILTDQVQNRDSEIVRLKILLEGGRPLIATHKESEHITQNKTVKIIKEVKELEHANENLRKELEKSLEKQHEAMLRALALADKNKSLQEELQKVDKLALKVEAECNKKLQTMNSELAFQTSKVNDLSLKNSQLEQELSKRNIQDISARESFRDVAFNDALSKNQDFEKQISYLTDINKSLQDKIYSLSQVLNNFQQKIHCDNKSETICNNSSLKHELQMIIQDERKKYETCLFNLQEKFNEVINHLGKYNKDKKSHEPSENLYLRDLHVKLCESENKVLMLNKENDELKLQIKKLEDCDKHQYKDIIKHLNLENTELSKENILLSQKLSQYKAASVPTFDRGDGYKQDLQKLHKKIEAMTNDMKILQKDKSEYVLRYKEAMDLADKLKRDLLMKQKEIENLEEENCSYRISSRTERATAVHIKDECTALKAEIEKLKSELIQEKTIANQIKNIQLESERSSTETHNELLNFQKKLSLANDTISNLEQTCKKLQSEIAFLKNDKSNLMDSIKVIDKERDELVIDLDNKTENISVLEQKIRSQANEINKLNNEITDYKTKLNLNRVAEHKIVDYESQIKFLNEEILRVTKQYDLAIIENKHLQNNIADANGMLRLTKIEYEKSKRDVESLKQQLQHYVAEIRRIEELLSEKEAERSDMLEHFASLSVEANILENTNHSLESESASKSLQLQTYISKIQELESKIADKDNIIDSQSARIAAMTCKLTALENDVKLITEEKMILEQNILYLKKKCNNMKQTEICSSQSINDHEEEIKTYENKIKNMTHLKSSLEDENLELKRKVSTTENLLSNARREIVDLKLALQDATKETKRLQKAIGNLKNQEDSTLEHTLSKEELEMAHILEDQIDEVTNEDNVSEHSDRFVATKYKYGHSSTM